MEEIRNQEEQLFEKVVSVNRDAKVTKGGKKMHFSACVIAGDEKGNVGFGLGKANEVAEAIRKGLNHAKKYMIRVPLLDNTIPHEVLGKYGGGLVLLKPAAKGTGVIAGGPVRSLCEAVGIKDILAKSLGSSNTINLIKATLTAFKQLKNVSISPEELVEPAGLSAAKHETEEVSSSNADTEVSDKENTEG